jgi:hypothetical protein
MKATKFTEVQIAFFLKQTEDGVAVKEALPIGNSYHGTMLP